MSHRNQETFSYGVVVLAAGNSRRMGRPKLLLPWGNTTVLGHLIQSWNQLQARQLAVVRATDAQAVQSELDRLHFPAENQIPNPNPERGMFGSIQCAAAWAGWNEELTHWMIVLGDQPHLRMETLRALLNFGTSHPENICQPLRHGRRRHPVLLPKRAFCALKDSSAADLKGFLELHASGWAGFESEDAGLDFDLDTPADYERARQLSFSRDG